jgi:hypothetical protein
MIFEVIGYSAALFIGGCVFAFAIDVISNIINSPAVDKVFKPPIKPYEYDYKPEELWEAPSYWKNWEKNV